MLQLKRVYDSPESADGARILVERLWPRGLTREQACLAAWEREVAPSPELRKWYGHVVDRWPEFRRRYSEELAAADKQGALWSMADQASRGTVTLVYAAHDTEHNGAVVLKEYLEEHFPV